MASRVTAAPGAPTVGLSPAEDDGASASAGAPLGAFALPLLTAGVDGPHTASVHTNSGNSSRKIFSLLLYVWLLRANRCLFAFEERMAPAVISSDVMKERKPDRIVDSPSNFSHRPRMGTCGSFVTF